MKTCNYCFAKLDSKYFGLCNYCIQPKCPAYGLWQVSVEDLSGVDRCMYCRKHVDLKDLFELKEDGDYMGYLCNKCLSKQIKLLAKKNEVRKSKG